MRNSGGSLPKYGSKHHENTVEINSAKLVHADSLQYIKTLPDNCIDAIITDPPYYRVKTNGWDNQWSSTIEFLAWLDEFFAEFWRVLKPSGSLYLFCDRNFQLIQKY